MKKIDNFRRAADQGFPGIDKSHSGFSFQLRDRDLEPSIVHAEGEHKNMYTNEGYHIYLCSDPETGEPFAFATNVVNGTIKRNRTLSDKEYMLMVDEWFLSRIFQGAQALLGADEVYDVVVATTNA